VVHGGLTAAIIDESFGGLLFSLNQAGALSFWGPAYTVQLEVSYKSTISAGRTVLCTTEVESAEGRKLWMKAVVRCGWVGG
jgi:acyl-coenzyme A thioesterase PaaI-like protein